MAGDVELAQLLRAAACFGLEPARRPARIAAGLMNPNWRVETPAGVFVLKQVRDVHADQALFQHQVTAALARRGFPAVAPLPGDGGGTLARVGDGVFACYPWVNGAHRSGLDLTESECVGLGELLARLHSALDDVAPASRARREPVTEPVTETVKAKVKIDRYMALVEAREVFDDFDRLAAARLAERRELLERYAYLRPDETSAGGPVGWVHGDFHHLNLLWGADGQIAAVLDWDRLKVWGYASELARAATLLFGHGDERGLDLDRVAAFAAGYRHATAAGRLTAVQIGDAVHRLWWERLCDLWQLAWHYERGDTSCDHLFVSASALLAWWSDHRGDVTSAFTAATG